MAQKGGIGIGLHNQATQRQEQTFQLTPQLKESIELLQLASIDVLAIIQRELEQNPFLTTQEIEDEQAADSHSAPQNEIDNVSEAVPQQVDIDHDNSSEDSPSHENPWDMSDIDVDDATAGFSYAAYHNHRNTMGDGTSFDEFTAETVSLKEHLQQQLLPQLNSIQEKLIASHLIDYIDNDGYIRDDLALLAQQLGCTDGALQQMLLAIQECEPTGVGARSLAECLSLQLADKGLLTPKVAKVLQHLELLARCQLDHLIKRCDVTQSELAQIIVLIKACDPKPGRAFTTETTQTVIADVIIRKGKLGQWLIELNSEILPKVLVNQHYRISLEPYREQSGMKQYISTQLNHAQFLVRALHQRAQSILKVATEIVFTQEMFLLHGINYLKPMTLADIASAIGLHESTISRIVNQKYIATPRGVFEMRYFFSSGVSQQSGTDISSHAVKEKIKELFDKEHTTAILSDEDVVSLLHDQGVSLSRRTVTKYREALGIPSSPQRRREKSLVKQ